ncbi:MAG TPA: sigma 54-interacting transcriptional regulator, partial [Desulfomonilaceae bacterium]|nr:sigma 54-interacting transcriptional regulator [Desulfomonilaceae bacterium]
MSDPSGRHNTSISVPKLLPNMLKRFLDDPAAADQYKQGDLILGSNNGPDGIQVLVSGEASVVLRDEDHERIAVDKLGPGDIFGEISFFTGIPWPSDAELIADEPCTVAKMAPQEFEKLLKQDADFTIGLIRNLVRKIMLLDRRILKSKHKRRVLQSLVSREDPVFSDYVIGEYVKRNVSARLEELAHSDGPVLIIGENGVGKEYLAPSIFKKSHFCKEVFLQLDLLRTRGESPLVEGLPEGNPESEHELTQWQLRLFFGSEEAAPDGVIMETPGYFELTEDGTLLVRGVEQLTPRMQIKLLEAVVTETFQRCGGVRPHKAKVRLLATTRLTLPEITIERHPLIFALLQRSVAVPPLRTRRKEIPVLVRHYLKKYAKEMHKEIPRLPRETMRLLVQYPWPGNDLELASTMKRAVLTAEAGVIRPRDIYLDLKKVERKGALDLLRFNFVRQAFTSPLFPAVLQSATAPFFFLLLAVLFLGPSDPLQNPAALFGWAVGWPLLIVGAFLASRFSCSVCPIGTMADVTKKFVALEKPFPAFLKNHSDFLIAGVVLFIIWLETATGMRSSPVGLGVLLMVMLLSAVIAAAVFERRSWCTYLCGLGGMAGLFAKTSLVELRADRNVCISKCSSTECYLGTGAERGCPFGHAGPRIHSNRLCTLCASCVKNCPHGAIKLNLRIPGREIWELRQANTGIAFLVISMMGGLLSEMATRLPVYAHIRDYVEVPDILRLTLGFVCTLFAVNVLMLAS